MERVFVSQRDDDSAYIHTCMQYIRLHVGARNGEPTAERARGLRCSTTQRAAEVKGCLHVARELLGFP